MSVIKTGNVYVWCGLQNCIGVLGWECQGGTTLAGPQAFAVVLLDSLQVRQLMPLAQ